MILAVVVVAVLLLVGIAIRQSIPALKQFFIPASVVAGFVGLAAVNVADRVEMRQRELPVAESIEQVDSTASEANEPVETGEPSEADEPGKSNSEPEKTSPPSYAAKIAQVLSGWPGPLIAVVFAAMLLQAPASKTNDNAATQASRVGRQGLMVWIIVLGETLVGLLVTWWFIQPRFEVPNSFGFLIETGFAGGHGTAAAMGEVYASDQVGLGEIGLDLGLLMATCGLVYGLVSGILWINVASSLGWIRKPTPKAESATDEESDGSPIGFATLPVEVVDPLLLQAAWIAIAVGLGMAMQAGVLSLAGWIDGVLGAGADAMTTGAEAQLSKRLAVSNVVDFPLFIYTMLGGWLVRRVLGRIGKANLIDTPTIQRLSSTAMEVLVIAAITSLRLSKVAELFEPFAILFLAGMIWTAFCLMVLSRWLLPAEHWFQLGLINYGMSTGTTATGFVLLRVVDPDLKTSAASDYALAAPLSAPFVGGGILTIGLPLLVMERVSIVWPTLAIGAVVASLIAVGVVLRRREVGE
ncbi:MAG: sodium:glutamate symporter [Planctomycetota bacterium]